MKKNQEPNKTISQKKMLEVKLNKDEILQYGKELAEKNAELVGLANKKKSVTSDFGSRINIVNERIAIISRAISTGQEFRDVDTKICFYYEDGIKREFREDTGSEISVSKLTDAEKQLELE